MSDTQNNVLTDVYEAFSRLAIWAEIAASELDYETQAEADETHALIRKAHESVSQLQELNLAMERGEACPLHRRTASVGRYSSAVVSDPAGTHGYQKTNPSGGVSFTITPGQPGTEVA